MEENDYIKEEINKQKDETTEESYYIPSETKIISKVKKLFRKRK